MFSTPLLHHIIIREVGDLRWQQNLAPAAVKECHTSLFVPIISASPFIPCITFFMFPGLYWCVHTAKKAMLVTTLLFSESVMKL